MRLQKCRAIVRIDGRTVGDGDVYTRRERQHIDNDDSVAAGTEMSKASQAPIAPDVIRLLVKIHNRLSR